MANLPPDFRGTAHVSRLRPHREAHLQNAQEPIQEAWIHKLSAEERFTWIYKNNYWSNAESVSGPGSTLQQNRDDPA